MNTQKTRLEFDYDSLYHGYAQYLKVGDKFSHNEGHIWEVLEVPETFPVSAIYTVKAKRLTGYPKKHTFNFGRFVSL